MGNTKEVKGKIIVKKAEENEVRESDFDSILEVRYTKELR